MQQPPEPRFLDDRPAYWAKNKPDDVALRALEQIGKALGYYAPQKLEVDHRHEVRVVGIEARIATRERSLPCRLR